MFDLPVNEKVTLRLVNLNQAEALFALIEQNRAYLGHYLSWVEKHRTLQDTLDFTRQVRQQLADGTDVGAALLVDGQLAGRIGLHIRDAATRKAEIGYWIGEEFSGQGHVTAAVRTMLDFGFTTLGMNRIFIRTATTNTRSAAIPQRLGFQYEGTHRAEGRVNHQALDLQYWSMLAHEWIPTHTMPDFWWRIDEDIALRPYRASDAAQIFQAVDHNRAHLRQWLPWIDATQSAQDSANFITTSLGRYARSDGGDYGIWWRGEFVGGTGYHFWNYQSLTTEIGYWLRADFTGKGIMTRAVRILTDYALRDLGLNRVLIRCATGNTASCAIPQRLGYTDEGVLRHDGWLYDRFVDLRCYAMLAQDWANLR